MIVTKESNIMKKNIRKVLFALIIGLFIMFIGNDVYAGRCDYDYLYGTITITNSHSTAFKDVMGMNINESSELGSLNPDDGSNLYVVIKHKEINESYLGDSFKDKVIFEKGFEPKDDIRTRFSYGTLEKDNNSWWYDKFIKNGELKCVDTLYYNWKSETKFF